ncbi:MAG: hypothetical protein Q8S15_07850 [Erysipelotrichaceae bacterium]|nr:hypothetical protein [Erysipelotrichaceae bacterium]
MPWYSILLFVLGVLYIVAAFIEIPFFYEGNPKTRFMIQKMGKKSYKILLVVFGAVFIALALYFR